MTLKVIMENFSSKKDVDSALLCDYTITVLRYVIHQLAPSVSAEHGRARTSSMAMCRRAISSLPLAMQTALLTSDPCDPDYGSAKAVTEALSRSPQVHVVYQGHTTPQPYPLKSRKSSSLLKSTTLYAQAASPARPATGCEERGRTDWPGTVFPGPGKTAHHGSDNHRSRPTHLHGSRLLQEMLNQGVFVVHQESVFLSRPFTVPQRDRLDHRSVVDLSILNTFISYHRFRC